MELFDFENLFTVNVSWALCRQMCNPSHDWVSSSADESRNLCIDCLLQSTRDITYSSIMSPAVILSEICELSSVVFCSLCDYLANFYVNIYQIYHCIDVICQVRRLTMEASDSGKPRLTCTGQLTIIINGSKTNFHAPTVSPFDDQQVSLMSVVWQQEKKSVEE